MLRVLALCCVASLGVPAPASAEWHFTPMAGASFRGNTTLLDPEMGSGKLHLQVGGAATLVGPGVFGVEAITVFIPSFFRGDPGPLVPPLEHGRSYAVMGNVVVTAPQRWTEYGLRPFVSGGLGLMRASQLDRVGLLPVASGFAGYNVGIGAVGFLSQRRGLRFDLRYYSSLNRPDQGPVALGRVHLSYMTASVGLILRR
ncbi:MAG: hypothetical protein M3545_00625 [Acidobacteriota bacterium]|nr:hypothetical protein [Acidobacteriota bacterium]